MKLLTSDEIWNKNPGIMSWIFAYIIAIVLDLLDIVFDLTIIGSWIPEIINFIGFMLLFPIVGKYIFVDVIELIPIVNILPVTTAVVFAAHMDLFGWRKQ